MEANIKQDLIYFTDEAHSGLRMTEWSGAIRRVIF